MSTNPVVRVLLGWLVETESTRREVFIATFFLVVVAFVGTAGFKLLEGWDWLDSLYMTFITITTIGFSEVRPLSPLGRLFTIFIGLVGIGAVAFIATRLAQLLLTNERLLERHMTTQIDNLEDHFVLCGYGRIGARIALDLERANKQFVVIDNADTKIERIQTRGFLYVEGNAEQEAVLLSAGIKRAKGLILTLPEDGANVFVTLTARELNPYLFILVRTDTSKNYRKLLRAGADKVVPAYEIGADRMAQVILRPNVNRFVEEVMQGESLDLNLDEVLVEPNSLLSSQSLAGVQFRQKYDIVVLGILSSSTGEMEFNPSASSNINAGDILIVLGSSDMIELLRKEACSG